MTNLFRQRNSKIIIMIISWGLYLVNFGCNPLDRPQLLYENAVKDQPIVRDNGSQLEFNEIHPMVETDGKGNWLVTYCGYYNDSSLACNDCSGSDDAIYDVYTLFSSDDGKTWKGPICIRTFGYSDSDQRVIEDGKGNWTLIWVARKIGGLGSFINITRITTNSWNIKPCDGGSWDSSHAIHTTDTTSNAVDSAPDIATDGNGNWVAVWYSYEPLKASEIYFSYSADDIKNWSIADKLNKKNVNQSITDSNPTICYSNGYWIVVWTSKGSSQYGSDGDILVSRSLNGQDWTDPVAIDAQAANDGREDSSPKIAADGSGNLMVVWEANYPSGLSTGKDNDIYYSQSDDNGVSWTTPSTVNYYANEDQAQDYDCKISFGGGKWLVVWSNDEVYNQNFPNNKYVLLTSKSLKEPDWLNESFTYYNARDYKGHDIEPDISVDPNANNNYLIVWTSDKNIFGKGTDLDIMYIRTKP